MTTESPESTLEADTEFLAKRMEQWSQRPNIHFVVLYQEEQSHLLAETLTAMSAQVYKGWTMSIIAPCKAPDPQLNEIPIFNWIQTPPEEQQQTLKNLLNDSDDIWFGCLRTGDQLDPSALLLVVDYINAHPSWKLIYTDENQFDKDGNIQAQLNKPEFDKEALEKEDFLGNSLFFSRYLFEPVADFHTLLDSHQRLGLKVTEQAGDYSIGHIPVVLYHTALENK
ncbi:MAG: hypothetical protein HN790_03285 [Methylococcales bacterium]|jgi:O-antigen biosynthesis protein|nr:hypothetical protein [Methylococcales bacterium]